MTNPPAFLLVSGSTARSLKTAYTTPANFIDLAHPVVLRSARRFHGPPDRSKQRGRHAIIEPEFIVAKDGVGADLPDHQRQRLRNNVGLEAQQLAWRFLATYAAVPHVDHAVVNTVAQQHLQP